MAFPAVHGDGSDMGNSQNTVRFKHGKCIIFFFFLPLERVEGREKERESNINVCLPLAYLYWILRLQPRPVP